MFPPPKQLDLTAEDKKSLAMLIEQDWTADSRDMQQRAHLYRRLYRLWRAAVEGQPFPAEDTSNFHIPLTQWQVLAKLAKEIDALLGDDAEVVVRPIGPSDAASSPKVARYMNWRIKLSLKIFKKMYDYLQQKIIIGTSIAHMPWTRRTKQVKVMEPVFETKSMPFTDGPSGLSIIREHKIRTGEEIKEKEVVEFEGCDLIVENIENWAVPPSARDIKTCERFERRLKMYVDEMLTMVEDGKFDKSVFTSEFVTKLRTFASTGTLQPDAGTDSGKEVRDEKRTQQGIPTEGSAEGREESLVVINWFGKFRKKSAGPLEKSEDVVAFWQPDTRELLGVMRLVDFCPDGEKGFIKSELIRDLCSQEGSFWGIGLPELLESINREMDKHHNQLTDAADYAIGPVIFYEPAAGFNPQSFKYDAFTAYPTGNAQGIKVLNLANINMGPYVALQPTLLGMAERISGLTEAEMGRPFAQPNAPRTLGQQQILSMGSGVRLLLDLRLERESLREMINRVWEMDKRYLPKPVFFRVSEAEELEQMKEEDFMGNFDFDIGPLTGTANKQQEIMNLLQAYTLALQNPIAAQNPVLLGAYMKKINTKMGQDDLNAFIPDMSHMAPPKNPEEENAMMMSGIDVDPHPMDNHQQHIAKHADFRERLNVPHPLNPGQTWLQMNPGVAGQIDSHIAEHEAAMGGSSMGMTSSRPRTGGGNSGRASLGASDPTGEANAPQNALKQSLNQGGLNIA